jgi:hypothetical protein
MMHLSTAKKEYQIKFPISTEEAEAALSLLVENRSLTKKSQRKNTLCSEADSTLGNTIDNRQA